MTLYVDRAPAKPRSPRPEVPPRKPGLTRPNPVSGVVKHVPGHSRESVNRALRENDVVIVCMGLSGAGKSTFISLLTDQPVQVGDSLQSCTVEIGIHKVDYSASQSVYLVDTPGFDDTTRSDSEILADIALLLATLYERRVRLAGILYLHRISDPKMSGAGCRSLRVLRALCGARGCPSVVFLTTMWSVLEKAERGRETGKRREEELATTFWADMLAQGSGMRAHDGSAESARSVVADLVERKGDPAVLEIQVQLVDEGRRLEDTAAGQVVQQELVKAGQKYEAELAEMKHEMELASKEGDRVLAEEVQREIQAAEKRVASGVRAKQALAASYRDLAGGGEVQQVSAGGPSQPAASGVLQPGGADDDGELPLPVDEIRKLEDELLRVQVELESTRQTQRHDLERERMQQERRHVEEMGVVQARVQRSQMELLQRQAELERQLAWDAQRRRAAEARGGGIRLPRFLTMLNPFSAYDDDDEVEDRYREDRRREERRRRRYHDRSHGGRRGERRDGHYH